MATSVSINSPDNYRDDDQVFADLIRLLYGGTLSGSLVQIVVIAILAMMQLDLVPSWQIVFILAYFAVAVFSRLLLNFLFNKIKPEPAQMRKWADYYTISIAFSGLGWMLASYFFIVSSNPLNLIFTALILGGISTGGLISLAAHLPSYYALLFPAMLSGILSYLNVATTISFYTAGLGAVLLAFLFFSAQRLHSMIKTNISLTFEYKFLFADLAKEKKTTDLLNENLKSEITERKSAELQMRDAMEKAELANKAKTEFLSSMSHELRTPLNAIMGYSQLIDHEVKETKLKSYTGEILRGGSLLLTLINQVLDLAKIEKGQVVIESAPASAEKIISDAVAMVEIQAATQNITLEFIQPAAQLPNIFIDQTRMMQTLLNILSNAIKYNTVGGRVTITAEETPEKFIRITITDTGRGISAEKQANIFEPFDRLGLEAGNIEGTGIGLSISKNLIELMGGKIDFQSKVGKGSAFWIDLPIATPEMINFTENSQQTSVG